jgi:hypothetical protein
MAAERPAVAPLLGKMDLPVDSRTRHPAFVRDGHPLAPVWTAEDCRALFVLLSEISKGATERAYDFWEFLSLVCRGINEEGICAY